MTSLSITRLLGVACCLITASCVPNLASRGSSGKLERTTAGKPPLAIIFVNSRYIENLSLHRPITKPDEVESLRYYLKTYGGFEVEENYEIVRKDGFEKHLESNVRSKMKGRDRIVVFYAGHGYGIERNNVYEDFLIPTQAPLKSRWDRHISDVSYSKLEKNCIHVRELIQRITSMMDEGQFCLFHFNACRGPDKPGHLSNSIEAKNRPNFPRNVSVAFSTLDGYASYDGHGTMTPYTEAFVSGLAANEYALKWTSDFPGDKSYYAYGNIHDIIESLMASKDNRQIPAIIEGHGSGSISYSTGNLTWDQYTQWRQITRGDQGKTGYKLKKLTDRMDGSYARKEPKDVFGDQESAIKNLTPAGLDIVLNYLYHEIVVKGVAPESLFSVEGGFLLKARKSTGFWISEDKFLFICDLVVPGLRERLAHAATSEMITSEQAEPAKVQAEISEEEKLLTAVASDISR